MNVAGTYAPESVSSLELGSQSEFLNHALRTKAVAFAYRYDNIPGLRFTYSDSFSVTAVSQSSPNARAFGAEASIEASLPAELIARASLRLLDARYGA